MGKQALAGRLQVGGYWETSKALEAGGFQLGEKGLGLTAKRKVGWWRWGGGFPFF